MKASPKPSHGGARTGAGRPLLVDTRICGFIIDQVREMGTAALRVKQRRLAVAQRPEYEEVAELHRKLQAETPLGISPDSETLEDIGYHFAKVEDGGLNLPRFIPSATLSPREVGKIYAAVAAAATQKFKKPISRRQIKRCVANWMREEADIKAHLEKRCR